MKLKTPLPLEDAERMIEGAFAASAEHGFDPLAVAVLDLGGNVICVKRQDGCGVLRVDVGIAKAWGALGMGLPAGIMGQRFASNPNFVAGLVGASGGRFAPNPGGVLVLDADGAVIGAVGISGDTGDNDEICAVAGIRAAGHTPAGV